MRLKGFEKLTGVDEALSTFLKQLKLERLGPIQIPLREALRRVSAEDFVAKIDLPPFDRSAVDGYAVRAEDTFEASQFSPKALKVTEGDRIGKKDTRPLWTGNPLPKGADAVVMLEHTKRVQDRIEVWTPVTPGKNVSKRGEDVQRGQVAVEAGTRLQSHHLGLLAALGATRVSVVEKPKVAVLSTGDELVEPSRKSKPNQIVDVNRLILSCMCLELGAEPLDLGIARDNVNEIRVKVEEGVKRADVTITTGGTSVGYADLVPAAVNQIGKPGVVAHGIAMRPGMPTALAILHGKPILILSGNPVAAMIGFEVFARPILFRLLGVKSEPRPVVKARITRRVAAALGRRVFLRVHTFERDGEFFADPVRVKGAGVLSTMTKANGYVVVPESREGLEEGELVTVHLFDKVGGAQGV
ncbi:MAG: molybdopterin molybdotransferase MoeA [Candidatus Bathyarchaeota archaeon]|nr:molybdopterin molybdotransferase MoeA [Candidatus Bathyarchaeota archaeon]MDH5713269.1 molybdopterin molybdotransferase MoeA [Candidatus Bathyarchaeota archaeon]